MTEEVVELFVKLIVLLAVLPVVTVPKSSEVGDTSNVPGVGDWPTPVNATLADGSDASLVMVTEPVAEPAADGTNLIVRVCDAPAASVIGKFAPLTLYPLPFATAVFTLIAVADELFFKLIV